MSFLSKIFKKKVKRGEREEKPKTEETVSASSEANFPAQDSTAENVAQEEIWGVLREAKITEKSMEGAKQGKYVFVVNPHVNKVMVKKAVEGRYGVEVVKVNVLNMPAKERRRGRQVGWKSGFKKAVVTLKEGQSIEVQ